MKRTAVLGVTLGVVAVGLSIAAAMSVVPRAGRPPIREEDIARVPVLCETKTTGVSAKGIAAMEQAAQANKYLFAFFWKNESAETTTMRTVFEAAMGRLSDRAQAVDVCVTDSAEADMVEKFGLDRAPMPLVLAIAPNGAIMGGFPQKFTEDELLAAFGSPCTERCMKVLQDGNLVLLCVQNTATSSNNEALNGAQEFAADTRYSSATRIVMLDPADPAEKGFLADLKITPATKEAVTAFLVPPGSVVAEFTGATTKEQFIAALERANTACGPDGCGPGGCGPKH